MQGQEWDVVILSWNRARSTTETVRNVLAQDDVNLTVWVIDQGSDSENLEVLREELLPLSVELVEVGRNLGVAGGRNYGMSLGSAPNIACIDNDALFDTRNALVRAGEVLKSDESIGAVAFRILNHFTGEDDLLSWVFPKGMLEVSHLPADVTRFCGAGHALRREALEATGGYDERLKFFWEETDLSYQLISKGYTIRYEPSIRVRHKVSPEMRFEWGAGRFFHQVRGGVYLDWKFNHSISGVFARILGYLIKGARNGLLGEALRGAASAFGLVTRVEPTPISDHAAEYIRANETRYRGSLWSRVRREVLGKLPGR